MHPENIPIFTASLNLAKYFSTLEIKSLSITIQDTLEKSTIRTKLSRKKYLNILEKSSNILFNEGIQQDSIDINFPIGESNPSGTWKPIKQRRKLEYDTIMIEFLTTGHIKIKIPLYTGHFLNKSAHEIMSAMNEPTKFCLEQNLNRMRTIERGHYYEAIYSVLKNEKTIVAGDLLDAKHEFQAQPKHFAILVI